ncbi:MAG TPA: hypothetical protein DCM28_23315 [Phycisphaerales bacterium]|nr:hypothetical protein [Phycisphaerales bacterium]
MPCPPKRRPVFGFTLIELLVVISIIVMLVAILLPALGKARKSALTLACGSNLRQVFMGLTVYADTYHRSWPLVYNPNVTPNGYYHRTYLYDTIYPGHTMPLVNGEMFGSVFICPSASMVVSSTNDQLYSYGMNVKLPDQFGKGLPAKQFGFKRPDDIDLPGQTMVLIDCYNAPARSWAMDLLE